MKDARSRCCAGGGEVEALEQSMSEIERKEDHGGAEGHGNLLDDFVSAALAMVTHCCKADCLLLGACAKHAAVKLPARQGAIMPA